MAKSSDTLAGLLPQTLLDACIHCGMCLPVCPTYQATGSEAESPRGRLYLMRAGSQGAIAPEAVARHLDPCLGCLACQTACPSGVRYGEILFQAREALAPVTASPITRFFRRWVFRHLLPHPARLKFLRWLLSVYQQLGLQTWVRKTRLLQWLPTFAQADSLLPELLPPERELRSGMSFGNSEHPKVLLMTGCVMDMLYRPIHWATIDALVANGYYVIIPPQTCCGALAHHAGEADIARRLARENLLAMSKIDPAWIVLNSAGCGAAMQDYSHLLEKDPVYRDRARDLSAKVIDVMALLAKNPLASLRQKVPLTVTYHAACHLHHAQGVQSEPMQVLAQIPGLTLVPLIDASTCCGSAGIYNLEHPALSEEILQDKIQAVVGTHADAVVTGNPGCMLQIAAGLRAAGSSMEVYHPVELIARAYQP